MPPYPLKIIATGHSLCTRKWNTLAPFKVPYFRIYYIGEGDGAVTLCGKHFNLEKGYVYFIPGNQLFINHCQEQMEVFWLHGIPTASPLDEELACIDTVLKWHFAEFAFFDDTFNKLGSVDLEKQDSRWYEIYALASCVVGKVLKSCESKQGIVEMPTCLKESIEFMNRSFMNNPSLEKIAGKANYAPIYFHRLFKRYYRVSPHQYMERKRMNLAHDLLLSSTRTIEEIAELSGYQNVFYFSRVFKKHFAISPGKMRKRRLIP